jgi:ribosomal 50S subunit-recycling heat shock protein
MNNVIPVYLSEDPYIAIVIAQLVTRSGQYYNMSMARHDIGSGRVRVNGTEVRKSYEVFEPGLYEVRVGVNTYSVQLHHSAKE